MALDKRHCVFLVLLDLSAAFDTVDHQVFLRQLQHRYGFARGALDWMSSYLTDREQHVVINGTPSDAVTLKYGFPQGSCIGPFGFKLYTKELTMIAQKHGIQIHLYADDTQLYVPFQIHESRQALDRLERCIEEIRRWMKDNFLKLNDSKTEFLILGAPRDLAKLPTVAVSVGDEAISPSETARNIGAYMDPALELKQQVANIVKACYFQLRSISKIHKYLSKPSAIKLCHAFISSRLDCLNSLLYKTAQILVKQTKINSK